MDFFDLVDLSEQHIELVNPTSPEKILALGRAIGLEEGTRVIDFGAGYAEVLILWAEAFGIRGKGIEIREKACGRARQKLAARGLDERIDIICASGSSHPVEPGSFDLAICIGATFIWEDFRAALAALSRTVRPGGRLCLGEIY